MFIAFPRQNWSRESASMLHCMYIACLVVCWFIDPWNKSFRRLWQFTKYEHIYLARLTQTKRHLALNLRHTCVGSCKTRSPCGWRQTT